MPAPSPTRLSLRSLTLGCLGMLTLSAPLAAQTPTADAKAKPAPKPPIVFVETPNELVDAFPGLTFQQPLGIVSAPGDKARLFVLEKTGRIQVITGLDSGAPQQTTFLDLTKPRDGELELASECGVLGLAFPPDHAKSGRCFVYYSLKIDGKLHQRVSRFQVMREDRNRADFDSEQPLFSQEDPASNHNGGDLAFGPDGYLYISVGDGGAGNDKFDNARFIDKGFHAAILRIDVDKRPGSLPPNPHPGIARDASGAAFYAVPKDNPFIDAKSHHGRALDPKAIRTELWATGLRNPWRISFDPATGRLFAGDVGQNLYEEVDIITRGGDYGWSHREALHPFTTGPGGDQEPADFKPIDPIFEYPRTVGLSITGGAVYHGKRFAKLKGAYVFGDYATGRVMALHEQKGQGLWKDELLAQEPGIAGIGVDPRDGELLFANLANGLIKRLQPKGNSTPAK